MLTENKDDYSQYHMDLRTSDDTVSIDVKWDGCVNINSYCNGDTVTKHEDESNRSYIHICDLQEFIALLQEAHTLAKRKGFEV